MAGRGSGIPDDLPRRLLPRSRATSLSRSEALSAVASRSHSPSPSFSRQSYLSTYHTMQPDFEPHLASFPMDHTDGWATEFNNMAFMTDSTTMNHHIGTYTAFENNDPLSQPRKSGRKELFADSSMPAGPSRAGPSSHPFYNEGQSSLPNSAYGLQSRPGMSMSGLKRKREESLEPIEPWLQNQNPPIPMSIVDDDPSPGHPYTIPRDRKGKGKEIDYKGKGKQREENPQDSPILISDSPINNVKPLATMTRPPSKPLSEPLSSYTCPICFCTPTNATLTPCGHICCGECLFTAVKTVMLRAQQAGAPDAQEARCPVCRALIVDWDGKGAGVIGLKVKAIFSL